MEEKFIINQYLICEREKIIKKIEELDHLIEQFPDGKLIYSKGKKKVKWFISNGSKPIYIPKKDYSIAQLLAVKKYYLVQKKELSFQVEIIDQFLKKFQNTILKSSDLLSDKSPYSELILSYFQQETDYMKWAASDYERNNSYSENLIHRCLNGLYVRSKSEVIIANELFINHIPFRYECQLAFNEVTIYPDFTMIHPNTGKIYYWEHFGLMDLESYRNNAFNKLKIYGNHNIIPSINLITTFETSLHPINSEEIHQIVTKTFLSNIE